MKTLIIIVGMALLLSACHICRHSVLADYAKAIERGQSGLIIVVYETPRWYSLGAYNAHVELRTSEGWFSQRDNPAYPQSGWVGEYELDEYLRLLAEGCFSGTPCAEEGLPTYKVEPIIEDYAQYSDHVLLH